MKNCLAATRCAGDQTDTGLHMLRLHLPVRPSRMSRAEYGWQAVEGACVSHKMQHCAHDTHHINHSLNDFLHEYVHCLLPF
jgi:hypothetical protein